MATFNGTSGDDTFSYGGADDDSMFGGDGNDSLDGGDGNDYIEGGNDNDTLVGGNGNDSIFGGNDEDLIYGGGNDDSLNGDGGDDQILGGSGSDTITNGSGNDTVYGEGGADSIYDGAGNDALYGGLDNDHFLMDEAGDVDTIYGGETGNDQDRIDLTDTVGSTGASVIFSDSEEGTYALASTGTSGTFFEVEEIVGTSANDTLDAALSTSSQTLWGESGNDTLIGSTAADELYGGSGNDTLTLGAGNDTAVMIRFSGDDVINDFDIADDDSDGFYNDQLDVSDLQNGSGGPITTADVTPVDLGGGGVRLDFPEGESITLVGVNYAQMSTSAQLYAAGIPCFTAGTPITTLRGQIPVECLRPGDRVLTRDNGFQPIVWVGCRKLGKEELALNPKLQPVRIAKGMFHAENDLLVSPQHGMLLPDPGGGGEILARAVHLARLSGGQVRIARGVRSVTYVHIAFERHQIVHSAGIWSESFYPGPNALGALDNPVAEELFALFPELRHKGALVAMGQKARTFAKFRDLPEDTLKRPAAHP